MTEQLQASISFFLAEATPAATPAASGGPSVLGFWLAIVLVGAGLTIFGIAVVGWLRRRTPTPSPATAESESMYDTVRAAPAMATSTPKALERAPVARPMAAPVVQQSPTTMEAQNLLRLMGEAEELCARLGRELDDKAQRIERLLARAEGRLGSDLAPQPAPLPITTRTPAYDQQPIAQPQSTRGNPPAYTPRPEIVTRSVGIPSPISSVAFAGPSPYYSPTASASQLQQQPASQPAQTRMAPAAPAAQDPFGVDPLTRDIYTLADAGHSAQAIAQQLGQHTGKVELILALRPG